MHKWSAEEHIFSLFLQYFLLRYSEVKDAGHGGWSYNFTLWGFQTLKWCSVSYDADNLYKL